MSKPIKIEIPTEVALDFTQQDLSRHQAAESVIRTLVREALVDSERDYVDKLRFKLCLLTCKGCGRLGLALVKDKNDGGYRITSHKCGGHWGHQEIFDCSVWESEFDKYLKRSKK